jgi:hypothetical protein
MGHLPVAAVQDCEREPRSDDRGERAQEETPEGERVRDESLDARGADETRDTDEGRRGKSHEGSYYQ